MNKEKQISMERIKNERLNRIKDYLVLFQWIDKSLDSQFEAKEISSIDFSKIDVSLGKELEGEIDE